MLRHRTPQHTRVPSCAVIVGTGDWALPHCTHYPPITSSSHQLLSALSPSPLFSFHYHTHRHPAPVTRATSANTTRDCPAEARMLTALSIEQYSFSTFTTLLYRPPCGGIALDVYNYS
jgi:hypothetical protein